MNIGQQNIIIQISVKDLGQLIENKVLEALEEYERRKQAKKEPKKELELVTVKVAAKITGKSENTIRNYIKKGELTNYTGIGRYKIMVSKDELNRCKENGTL